MNNSKRYDVHCHMFSLDMIMAEVSAMAIYYVIKNVRSTGNTGETISEGYVEDIWTNLESLLEFILAYVGDNELHYRYIQQTFQKTAQEQIAIAPQMLDIFYMFDGILDSKNYGDKYKSFNSTSKDNAINIILDRIKNYISGKRNRFSEEEITQCINEIENTKGLKYKRDSMGLNPLTPGYYLQYERLKQLHTKHPQTVFPFFAFDPRRPRIMDIVEKEVNRKSFYGIKLYTRLGFHPDDKGMKPLYQHCIKNDLPIVVHTSNEGFPPIDNWEYTENANPAAWSKVLAKNPKLRIDFAHFGGSNEVWTNKIIDFMEIYDNVYADLSYSVEGTLASTLKYWKSRPIVQKRLLFGTDYPMIMFLGTLENYCENFLKRFDESQMYILMVTNTQKFLKID